VLGRVAVRNKDKEHELISSFPLHPEANHGHAETATTRHPSQTSDGHIGNKLIDDGAQTVGRHRDDEFPELDGLQAADRSSFELPD
jgi:hypothetical protein